MSQALRDRPTEELRQEIRDSFHRLVGDLLSAAQIAHLLDRVGEMNLKWVQGLGDDTDKIAEELRSASENFRKAQAAIEVLADRAKAEKL